MEPQCSRYYLATSVAPAGWPRDDLRFELELLWDPLLRGVWWWSSSSYNQIINVTSYTPGVARLFFSQAKFENYFSIGAALFKLTYNFWEAKFFFDLFNAYWEEVCTFFVQICLNRLKLFTCQSNKKGPRAAKISWRAACGPRAALWPCLPYTVLSLNQSLQVYIKSFARKK